MRIQLISSKPLTFWSVAADKIDFQHRRDVGVLNQSGWVCDLAEDSAFPMAKTEKPSLPSPPTVATVLAMKAGRVVVVIVFAVFLLAID